MEGIEQDQAPTAALTAWRDLVTSEGWRLLQEIAEKEWGAAATLEKIETASRSIPAGETASLSETVMQIQVARREVLKLMKRPAVELDRLTPKERAFDPMHAFRRIGR